MVKRFFVLLCGVIVFTAFSAAHAEEHFGIPVYPGAKPDAASGKWCSVVDPSGKFAYCFRTSDAFEKVAAFYAKQPNLKAGMKMGSEGMYFASFCPKEQEGCPGMLNGIDVTLNSPWSTKTTMPGNAKAGDFENKDVRIRIYNKDAQMKAYKQ